MRGRVRGPGSTGRGRWNNRHCKRTFGVDLLTNAASGVAGSAHCSRRGLSFASARDHHSWTGGKLSPISPALSPRAALSPKPSSP